MHKVISLQNNKGGVGKTFLTHNLCGVASELGKRSLIIDFDEQADISKLVLGHKPLQDSKTSFALVVEKDCQVVDAMLTTPLPNTHIVVGAPILKSLDTMLASSPDALYYFKEKIVASFSEFDYIFFDLPTNLHWTVRCALSVSDMLLIPVLPELTAIVNSQEVVGVANSVRKFLNPALQDPRYVLNMVRPCATHNEPLVQKEHIAYLRSTLGLALCSTTLYSYALYQMARAKCQPITSFAPKSQQAEAVRKLFLEVCDDNC
jgi:chromosome partitioning protein